jgi:hypothetical protein
LEAGRPQSWAARTLEGAQRGLAPIDAWMVHHIHAGRIRAGRVRDWRRVFYRSLIRSTRGHLENSVVWLRRAMSQPTRDMVALALSTVLVAGCDRRTGSIAQQSVRRDSAGIEVVDNAVHGSNGTPAWILSERPRLTLTVGSDPRFAMSDVSAAFKLDDGHVVLAATRQPQVLLFSPDGQLVRRIGRVGSGPGEFQRLDLVQRYRGDSILVFEGAFTRRLSVFAANGSLGRTWIPPGSDEVGQFLVPMSTLSNGSLLTRTINVLRPADPPRVERPNSVLAVIPLGGNQPMRFAKYSDTKRFAGRGAMLAELFFTPQIVTAASPGRIVIGTTDIGAFDVFGLDGRHIRRVTWTPDPWHVELSDIERERQKRIASMRELFGNAPQLQEKYIDGALIPLMATMPMPTTFPAFGALISDAEGNVVALPYGPSGRCQNQPAHVFDSTGRLVGRLEIPKGLCLTDLGRGYAIGVRLDSLDLARVEVYELLRR